MSLIDELESGAIELTQENIDDWINQWLQLLVQQANAGGVPEMSQVDDRAYLPAEAAAMAELLQQIAAGEEVDLSQVEQDYPEFYEWLSNQEVEEVVDPNESTVESSFEENVIDDDAYTIDPNLPVEETNPLADAVAAVTEAFPTWEDLWGAVQDSLPSNPQEWGGAIRGVIEAAGVDLPSGDVWEILNGGYGVTTDISSATGGIAGILDPANQMVFVPGIPVGLPPSSMIIGSIEDLVTDPIGTLEDRVTDVFGSIVADPGGFVQGILAQGADVPPELWSVLIGGVQAGQEIIDWVTGAVGGNGEDATGTAVSGTETTETTVPETTTPTTTPPPETATFGPSLQDRATGLLSQFQNQLEQTQTSDSITNLNIGDDGGLGFGHESNNNQQVLTGGIGENQNTSSSVFSGSEDHFEFVDPSASTEEEPILSGGGGGGGGGAGGSSAFSPFWSGIAYNTPTIAPIIQSPRVASLFKEYIG